MPKSSNIATFSICIRHNGKEQIFDLPVTPAVLGWLALEAASQNKGITELAKDLVLAVTEKDLIEEVLKK